MTVRDWIRNAKVRLHTRQFQAANLEAELLAAYALGVNRTWIFAHPESEFPELAGEALLQRRESHEPLAYILGYREFYGRTFKVDPRVLIPRQETEVLIEVALALAGERTVRVLDLATGSGCVGITLKLERPGWDVTLSDISPSALDVAAQNCASLGASARLVESDLFGALLGESFDLIVTNPPYIGENEAVPAEVRAEPAQALFAGPRGTEFYERLADEALDHLNDRGRLVMEIGYRQADDVKRIFTREGWSWISTNRDLDGNERVVAVEAKFACA
jgi:release factor glutamine methyltransferase